MGPPGGTKTTGGTDTNKAAHARTEFVVLFIWKEPTPSDNLMAKPDENADASGGQGPGNMMGSQAPPPGVGSMMPGGGSSGPRP
jgi:hypothetical protein